MRIYSVLLGILLICSCNKLVDKKDLSTYLNDPDNGLKKEVQSGDYKMSLTYRPTELIIDQNLADEEDLKKREEKKKQYEAYYYFILNMSLGDKDLLYKGSESKEQFSVALNKLNFGLSDYVYAMTDTKDTIYLSDYYVPNLYGMGGSTQVMLAFPRNEKKVYQELEIRLKELGFGIGEQRFIFQKKDLDNIPELKL